MASAGPRFSIVSAAYNVSRYLPDFIASLESQAIQAPEFEVIMVDDGSTDTTGELLDAWARRRPDLVQVLHQENRGQASARNAGLEVARGTWVTFPDPDDVLAPGYFENVARFMGEHPDVDMVVANRWLWFEGRPPANTHPLRHHHTRDRLIDLDLEPHYFSPSAPASFLLLPRIRELGIRFDERIRPHFEDCHFNACYLLASARPKVGFLRSAKYHYRKRADGSSALSNSRSDPDRYGAAVEYGYLDLIARATETTGEVPGWLQHLLCRELSNYFELTDSQSPAGAPTHGPVATRFNEMIDRVAAVIDMDEVIPSAIFKMSRTCRYAMHHGLKGDPWHEPEITVDTLDERQRLIRADYYYCGEAPAEEIRCDGTVSSPKHAKVRTFTYFGRDLLHQRIMWLPSRQITELRLDGVPMQFQIDRAPMSRRRTMPGYTSWMMSPHSQRRERVLEELGVRTPSTKLGERARRLSQKPRIKKRYRDAWVLMDKIHEAGDSGEILFRHLRTHHPDVNAWFVIERGTPDWKRLRAEGFGNRLVAHGSMKWLALMAHCRHLVSSHADRPVTAPPAVLDFVTPQWKFTFLQHGVIKDDLSAWLASKKIDTFITSSRAEHASIAGDGTPYPFTTKETVNTGLPRFDRLLTVGKKFPPAERDLVLMAPTWRSWLVDPHIEAQQRRTLEPTAMESEFVREWMRLMRHPAWESICDEHKVKVGFLPHPNLQSLLPHLDLPVGVEALTYAGNDVQTFFARSRVLVTDFSSVAFNSAYLERPTVYYQFDEERVLEGDHVGHRGYFEYRHDGFGPVTGNADEAVAAIREALAHGTSPLPVYQARIEATFPDRDGRCCERVVSAILNSDQPQGGSAPTPTPTYSRST